MIKTTTTTRTNENNSPLLGRLVPCIPTSLLIKKNLATTIASFSPLDHDVFVLWNVFLPAKWKWLIDGGSFGSFLMVQSRHGFILTCIFHLPNMLFRGANDEFTRYRHSCWHCWSHILTVLQTTVGNHSPKRLDHSKRRPESPSTTSSNNYNFTVQKQDTT